MLAPICPHLAEELWAKMDKPYSVHLQSWPKVDEAAAAEEEITLVVQVNGKLRDRITVPVGTTDEAVKISSTGKPGNSESDGWETSPPGDCCTRPIGEYRSVI